ncbi:MAG: hypothetical protein ACRDQA_06620 [Nocardioidaceae bacterium]
MTEQHSGNVVDVEVQPLMTELVSDAAVNDTVLAVDDMGAFAEDGGQLLLGATVLEYVAAAEVDEDSDATSDTITLADPLATAASSGDPVYLYPSVLTYTAFVEVGGYGDGDIVSATIPHGLVDAFREGARSGAERENVLLSEDESGMWFVTDILARTPVLDGSFIDSDTLPTPPKTDGDPPSTAPTAVTVVGVPRQLIVGWQAISNADPVTYEVHVSDTNGFTPGPSTLHHTTASTLTTVETLPGGTPLVYESGTGDNATTRVYYLRIVGTDDDGTGPASDQASGSLDKNGTADLEAGSITAASLEAVMVLASTIQTAESGRRVVIDNTGLTIYGQAGEILFAVGTDPVAPIQIQADVEAQSLTVSGMMTVNGLTNSVTSGSSVSLAAGITDPTKSPTVAVDHASLALGQWGQFDDPAHGFAGLCWDGTRWVAAYYNYLESWDANGGFLSGAQVDGNTLLGVTYLDSVYYTLDDKHKVKGWTLDWVNGVATKISEWDYTYLPESPWRPDIGNDGTDLVIAQCPDVGDRVLHFYTFAPATGSQQSGIKTDADHMHVHSLNIGAFDYGATRYVVHDTGANVHVFDSSGNEQANEAWPMAAESQNGMGYDGTNFYSYGGQGNLWRYETGGNMWTSGPDTWWVSYTWYDSDTAGTGTHETAQSTRRALTMRKRARLVVQAPPIGDLGGDDDPDTVVLYIGTGSSDPGILGMHYQTEPAAGASVFITDYDSVYGGPPPAANTFPALLTPAEITDSLGNAIIDGTGAATPKTLKVGSGLSMAGVDAGIDYVTPDGNGLVTIAHSLGVTPSVWIGNTHDLLQNPHPDPTNTDASSIAFTVVDMDGSLTPGNALNVNWVAIAGV